MRPRSWRESMGSPALSAEQIVVQGIAWGWW